MSFTPGANASSPDVGAMLLRADALLSPLSPCASVCRRVESDLLSAQQPSAARSAVVTSIARASGLPLPDLLLRWDAAQVREGRPLAEAVAFCQERGHAHAARLADALVRLESLSHVALVWHQAHKVAPSFAGYAPADLVGWGWAGLRMALKRYDPSLGYRFSTYACTRIVGSIRDGVRAERPVPKRLGTFQRRLDEVSQQLEESLGRQPTVQELSEVTGEPTDKVMAAHRARPALSLDELSERSPGVFGSEQDAPYLPDPQVEAHLQMLPPLLRQVVRLSVLEGLSDAETAAELGPVSDSGSLLAPSAVGRLREEALSLLRAAL